MGDRMTTVCVMDSEKLALIILRMCTRLHPHPHQMSGGANQSTQHKAEEQDQAGQRSSHYEVQDAIFRVKETK